jgi:acetyl-CoA carboxylase biotin carboxyl carrier protein
VSLSARDVAEILRVLEESSFDTLDLDMGGVQLRLRRSGAALPRETAEKLVPPAAAPSRHAAGDRATPIAGSGPSGGTLGAAPEPGARPVPAPLLGIYYRAPKPGEPPFVEVGDKVHADSIIGIIEVMKLMNTVRAGVAGEVVAISAPNGELVEYGQALLWIRAD